MMTLSKRLSWLVLILSLSGCHKAAEDVKDYLEKGVTYYKQGDYSKARLEFRNVIQIDKKQSSAFYHLALIDEKEQNWPGMFANLSQVVILDPKNDDAHLRLGRLFLLSGEFDKTQQQIDIVLKASANHPNALVLKGALLLKQGKSDEAIALVDRVLKQDPLHIDAVSLKSAIYLSKNDYPAALATVEKLLQSKPDELSLNMLRLQIHNKSKNLAAIEQDYLDLIKRFPDKLEFSYALARHYSDQGQNAKTEKILQEVIKNNADKLMPKLVFVDYLISKKPEQAEKTLKDYIVQQPEEAELSFRLVNFYIKNGKYPEAKQQLNLIVEHKKDSKEGLAAKVMLAKLALQQKDYKAATAIINEVLTVDTHHYEALLLKARINWSNNLNDEAIADLRNIVRDYPKSDEALVLLAQAYLKKSSPELAEESFRKALELNPGNFSAVMAVTATMIESKDLNRASEVLQKALSLQPNHPGFLKAFAQVKLLAKEWTEVTKIADLIATKPDGKGYAKYLTGKISQGQGDCKAAIAQYKEVLAISPRLVDALQEMAGCYKTLKQSGDMLAYLEEYIKTNPDIPYPVLLKSELLMAEQRMDDAVKILTAATDKWPQIPELYQAMAQAYAQKQDKDRIIAIYVKALGNIPDNIGLRLALASAYEEKQDYAHAMENYEALIAKQPNLELAVNNLASLLLDHGNTKEDVERALKLTAVFEKSAQPYFLDTYGWALLNNNRNNEALQVFKNVTTKMPEVAVFKYHLGMAYHKARNNAAAISEWEQALAIGAKSGGFAEKNKVEQLLNEIKASK
jgi:tetratricopeptide (TPR) repeat protein